MSKTPTPKLDSLREMREARFEENRAATVRANRSDKELAALRAKTAAIPVKKVKKVKP